MSTLASAVRTASLFFRAGSSDKVYHVALLPDGDGFVVTAAWGRRGGTLQTGRKTAQPVSREAADAVFDRLVAEKEGKGYKPGGEHPDYVPAEQDAEVATGWCQMLTPATERELEALLLDPAFVAQPKRDGVRLRVTRSGGTYTGHNKKGKPVPLHAEIARELDRVPGDFALDGESVGGVFHAFDLHAIDGVDVRSAPYRERLALLARLLLPACPSGQQGALRVVPTAEGEAEKRAMLAEIAAAGEEGIVFKRSDAPHTPGAAESGGDWYKYKLYATCTARVCRLNSRQSVGLEMLDGGAWVEVGNVTLPSRVTVAVGSFVEVRYLYAYRGGSLYQPVLLCERSDVDDTDCSTSQLKYKPEGEAVAA